MSSPSYSPLLPDKELALDTADEPELNREDPGGCCAEEQVTVDPVQLLRRRNDRAVQFLVSIASSHVVDSGLRAATSTNRKYDAHFDIDPQRVLDLGPSGSSAWNEARSGSHFTGNGASPDARPSRMGFTALTAASGRIAALSSGGAMPGGKEVGDERPLDMGYSRRLSYAVADYSDMRNAHHPTEFVPMKSSTFPMVFASIKPFRGPGEEKYRSVPNGGLNDKDQAVGLGTNKADQSFAHILYSLRTLESEGEHDIVATTAQAYQPNRLDDPGLHKGLQRTVLGLTGYMGTIFEYTRPDDLRQELNDHFRETHPELCAVGLTLDQIRRLRAHMLRVTREQDLELSTAAIAWVYFEKLIWKGFVIKDNRKLVAGKTTTVLAPNSVARV
ncbi:hypothetical protein GGF42_006532 [Coemansia sp. RSA 2424]|nr:hypothetical protein GGF42_006532 [Coemansia sp. RSA 2424]